MKKLISILCIMALTAAQIGFLAEVMPMKADAAIDFSCGENLTWYIDTRSRVLTISGTGPMYPYYDYTNTPAWKPYEDSFNTVIIEEGVTSIAEYAFFNYSAIKNIQLPSTLNRIGVNAFAVCKNIESISVADNSELAILSNISDFAGTKWYKNQPDGLIYLGDILLGYKGTVPENTEINLKDGTRIIADKAFYNQSNLTKITFPGTIEYVGEYAFEGTGWYNSQPAGEIYIDNVLYKYKDALTIEEYDFVVRDGTTAVSPHALEHKAMLSISFPDSIKYIGKEAFYYCTNLADISISEKCNLEYIGVRAFFVCGKLESFDLPQNIKVIESTAFSGASYQLETVNFPASVEFIGLHAYSGASKFTVDKSNPYYSSDEYGVVFDKDKTILYFAPRAIDGYVYSVPDSVNEVYEGAFYKCSIREINFPSSVKKLGEEAFYASYIKTVNFSDGLSQIKSETFAQCNNLEEITIPESMESISGIAFAHCQNLKKAIIPATTTVYSDAFEDCKNLTIYCYTNSSAHTYAIENDIPFVLLDEVLNTELLTTFIDQAQSINRNIYSHESLAELDAAVSAVNLNAENLTQTQVNEWENAIKSAIDNLKYKPADYYAIEIAQKRAENLDRSLYTFESLAVLDSALSSVEENLDITNQSKVNSIARTINEAIDNLEYLPADYVKVEAAISESEKYDRRLYSQATLAALEQSISAVEYGLNITEQSRVDGFAEQIINAISALEYAAVVLRNEPHGVIVSATAKEIDPDTALTVDLKDSSDLQSGNFAVGGTVKSITLYDINLLLNAQKTQPEGLVTVKIKLPDGVDSKRCKVYHIIDDPVDPLVRYSTSLEGNFIVFETDHFSEFAVIEVETVLNSIEITKQPNKTIYALGETVNTSGLEVIAYYSDGSTKIVSDYDVSSVDTSSIGTKTITVYHTYNGVTKSDSFEINVTADKINANITFNGKDVNEYNKKVAWYRSYSSESVKLDCSAAGNYRVEWSSDNSKVLVDSNGNVTNKGFFFARKATITVKITDSAGNVLATDSIIVRFYKLNFQLSGIQSTMVQAFKKSGLIF